MGSILRCPLPVIEGAARHACIVALKDNKMGSIPTWIDLVYIMSSFLLHYSVFHELNTLDACWIAVDLWSNSGRCRQESVYLSWTWWLYNDHRLGYRRDYSIFYQLANSNLFTHRALYSWEKPLVNPTAPGSTFPTSCFMQYATYFQEKKNASK